MLLNKFQQRPGAEETWKQHGSPQVWLEGSGQSRVRELADCPGVLFSGKSTLLVKVVCLPKCTGCAVEWDCLRHLGNASNYSVQLSNKQHELIRINTPRKVSIAFFYCNNFC